MDADVKETELSLDRTNKVCKFICALMKLVFALVFHSFPNQSEVIGFASFGMATDHANINVGLAVAIMFKILWFGLRALRHNQDDRL